MENGVKLYIICGFLGAGKTTFSKKMAQEIEALHLNPDETCCRLFSKEEYEGDWETCFSKAVDMLWEEAKKAVQSGVDVIFDMGFWTRESRDLACQKALEIGAQPVVYYIYAPDEVLKSRIALRKGAIAENNMKNFSAIKELFEEPSDEEVFVKIDNF